MGSLWKNLRFWLFIATLASTSFGGFLLAQRFDPNASLTVFSGLPYAISIMFILGCHEMGHYLTARWWGMKKVTLPLFIPMPLSILGTFGALISVREPFPNRKALFDIGLAGPWAGLAAAGLLYFLDFPLSPLYLHQVDFAVNVGILITFLNLFPFGMLDGGHAFYAVTAKKSATFRALIITLALIYGGFFQRIINPLGLLIIIVFARLTHSPTQDDDISLGRSRMIIAALTVVAFFVMGAIGKPIKF